METIKKYIFPVAFLIFVIGLTTLITKFTQPPTTNEPKFIEGWKHITFDQLGNSYYIDLDSITKDSQEDVNLFFHATYLKVYSDKGREAFIDSYSGFGVDIQEMQNIDHEIEVLHFKDFGGEKLVIKADCKFYRADDSEISALNMAVSTNENNSMPIPGKTIGEHLYDYAFNRLPKESDS